MRYADHDIFEHALRYHGGGFAGSGLLPDEVPIIARRGELVVPPERVMREEKSAREQFLFCSTPPELFQSGPASKSGMRRLRFGGERRGP